jgi:uncharacterized repeat protein (TIGR01451 family)
MEAAGRFRGGNPARPQGGSLMTTFRGALAAFASLAVALALVSGSGAPAAAQVPPRPVLVVTVNDSPDPAPSAGKVVYAILVKNDGTAKAKNVVVTVPVPSSTAFDKCTMVLIEGSASTPCTPGLANGIVTVNLGNVPAHKQPRVNLTLAMPAVSATTTVTVSDIKANGDDVTDSDNVSEVTTILPPGAVPVTFLPSGRTGVIACGLTLSPDFFGADTTVKLGGGLGCTSEPYGLKMMASEKTIDLNQFKIVGVAALGNVGIFVKNAAGVTIIGGANPPTNDSSGIEFFDWCVKDDGKSARLTVTNLRCFRARTAGIDIISKKASIIGVLVDRAIGTTATTAELPGGVGIRTRGHQTLIKDSIIRQAGAIGVWVAGSNAAGSEIASIEGDKASCSITTGSKMLIEKGTPIGLLLDGGPHFVKNVCVKNLYNDREDPPIEGNNGVVVGLTGLNNLLEGVVVKQYGGNAFVVDGTGTTINDSSVELVALDGFVVTGPGSTLSGNSVQNARHGFIVTATALDTDLETNEAQDLDGDGFAVDGDTAVLISNTAQDNGGRGFVIGGDSGLIDSNTAENNIGDGFIVTGSNNAFKNNTAESNNGIGFKVSGSGNDFNTNSASSNDGPWEWTIAPGQTQVGGKTNKVAGKTFCIPPAGGNFNVAPTTGACP